MAAASATLVKWMSVLDANNAGRIHGGTVMKLCDEAAGLAAIRHARRPAVTAAVDRLTFLHPVFIGEVLTLRASVNAAWETSMEVGVRVESENPLTGEVRHTSSAYLTMVAVDEHGNPATVPPLVAEGEEEAQRERAAQERRERRLAERARERSREDQSAERRQHTQPT
ncbi:MAG TPA: acyl-CoA thioesterase [Solirubrobacteraceae bacterium]|nr:acyl-CoA thioesterase [Solirubrobacteraceae bacterium]